MSDFFRTDAVRHKAASLHGTVMVGARMPWLALGYTIVAVLLALLITVCTAQYSRKESVAGIIVPRAGIIRAAAIQGGLVTNISVAEGQVVEPNATVAELQLAADSSDGNSGKILETAATNEQIAAKSSGLAQIEKVRIDHLQLLAQKAALQSQYEEASRMKEILTAKVLLSEKNLSRVRELNDKGFISARSLDEAQASVLDSRQQLSNSSSAMLSLAQQLKDLEVRLSEYPILLEQARSQARSVDASMAQKLEQVRAASTYLIRSPVRGVVMAIPVKVGQTVQPGSTIAIVTPEDGRLEAELYVPSKAIGFIRADQDVSLQYEAFSYKKFGIGRGKVLSVSHSPLTSAEASMSGISVSEAVFRVRVGLENDYINAYGRREPLQPGMLLKADIIVEKRTVVDWLLDPLYAVGKR